MDYRARRSSDKHWMACSKKFIEPVDGTHFCVRIPARSFVEEIIVEKTVAYDFGMGDAYAWVGFSGNNEASNNIAFLNAAGFRCIIPGVVSSRQGTALNAGGKYFSSSGAIIVTSYSDGETPGTFQVYVKYTQLTN